MTRKFSLMISLIMFVGLVITAGLLTGCSPAGEQDKTELEAYRIGAVFAVTGRAAPLGEPEKETVEMLVEEINASGGINGHKIDLYVEDTEGDETKALLAAKKLIEQKNVLAVVGPSTSGTTLAIVKTFEEAETTLVSCAASVKIVEPIKPWVFKTPQTDRDAVSKILTYLEKEGLKKVAFINDSNAYGMSGRVEMENLAPKRGFDIVAIESFGGTDTDMTPQLTRIKGAGAQAIICWGTNPGPAVVTRNMKQLNMDMPLFQSHGVANMKFIELAGEAAEGVMLPAGRLIVADQLPDSDVQKKVLQEYAKNYTDTYNKPVSTFGGHAYDSLKLVVGALEKVGADKAKIREEIENTTGFVGTGGVFNFSPEEHTGLTEEAFVMVRVENGTWKLVQD